MADAVIVGTAVVVWVEVRDRAGALADPAGLSLRRRQPGGVELPPVDLSTLTRTGPGRYEHEFQPASTGEWWVRWEAVDPTTTIERRFTVAASRFG